MTQLGVMEIFYGVPWSELDRASYIPFLKEIGFQYYIYGPKGDACLRKNWRERPTATQIAFYQRTSEAFARANIKFGLIMSPHGLSGGMKKDDKIALVEKMKAMADLNLAYFGLFFDDMKSDPHLAERQLEILDVVQSNTKAQIIFCPSFYSFDPMLELLFGERPANYLEALGQSLPKSIEILWTGEEIISAQITPEHLASVTKLLGRKPFICDNFFANDTPVNCNFLRLQPLGGRNAQALTKASHWAFNPMNQAHLSKLILRAAAQNLMGNQEPTAAMEEAIRSMTCSSTAELILAHRSEFASTGLDSFNEDRKAKLCQQLKALPSHRGVETELLAWLQGNYNIDLSVMMEQSCFFG